MTGSPPAPLARRLSHERMLHREDKRSQAEYWSAQSTEGGVATAHYLATRAGAQILADGGNAFDAAVAAALSLAVCEPAGSGLGGMATMVAYDASRGRIFAIEGACRAPQDATPEALLHAPSRYRGYQAVAVPTQLAVLQHVLERYGTLSPSGVLEPARRLAEDGVPVSACQHQAITTYADALRRYGAGRLFLDGQGKVPRVGDTVRQPVLAQTLGRLAAHGFEDFYRGSIARDIVQDMKAHGGFVNARDLASSQLCGEQPPLEAPFSGGAVRTIGPPGGGLALLQMLNVLAAMDEVFDLDTPEGAVRVAAVIRQVRRDRRAFGRQTDARGLGKAARLLTPEYATRTAERITAELENPGAARPITRSLGTAAGETSHVSVMDRWGNVVAMTLSIERSFGAAVMTPTLGFLYNGYLRAFKVQDRRHPHFLRPGAPARSNAAPTIGMRNGRPWVALGSTGSERMASGIFQVLVRLERQQPFDAVHAPRLHCTPESQVLIEADRVSPENLEALKRHGFTLQPLSPYAFQMGGLQLVLQRGEIYEGVGEPRRDGAAAGP